MSPWSETDLLIPALASESIVVTREEAVVEDQALWRKNEGPWWSAPDRKAGPCYTVMPMRTLQETSSSPSKSSSEPDTSFASSPD